MNLSQALESVDLSDVIDRMNAYAIYRLKSVRIKSFNGKEPVDFVGGLLLKVMEGTRDWEKADCSFTEFLFGCLRSDINGFFKTMKKIHTDVLPEIKVEEFPNNIQEQQEYVSKLLKKEGADDDELLVFECWVDGITKPMEVAEDLGVDVKEVYNITKRLTRSVYKIETRLIEGI